jgi:hypothetical protein
VRDGSDRDPAPGRITVLEQGQSLDGVTGDRAGEDGAGPVGGRDAHPAARAERRGDRAEGDLRVVDDLEHVVAQRQVEAALPAAGSCRQHLLQEVAVALQAEDPITDAGGVRPAAERGQGVRAGVDDGHLVPEPGQRNGEHAAATADVEHP